MGFPLMILPGLDDTEREGDSRRTSPFTVNPLTSFGEHSS